jgi:hypothetical protein
MNSTTQTERRAEPRIEADDIVRWKRPGRIEDEKAWIIDRSPNGLGFLTTFDRAPQVGDALHVRRMSDDRWAVIDRPIRVARTTPLAGGDLVMVGCAME